MKLRKKPRNFEKIDRDNSIIAYVPEIREGIAIVRDEEGELFYMESTEDAAILGYAANYSDLIPIERLNREEKEYLQQYMGWRDINGKL